MDLKPIYPLLCQLKPSDQVVFIHLFQHLTEEGVYASQKDLITWTGIKSINTIKTALNRLIKAGFVKCLKPGQPNAPAFYQLCLPGAKEKTERLPEQIALHFNSDNQLRLAAIKKGFSPATWEEMKREARGLGMTEDAYLIRQYFGPERVHG